MTDETNEEHRKRMVRINEIKDRQLASATKEKGLVIVHTGAGKGKSTAAFGMAIRALGQGMKVGIVQFIKGAIPTGEAEFIKQISATGMPIEMHTMGEGFTWKTQDRERDIATAMKGWDQAVQLMRDPSFDLIVLDELNIATKYDYVPASVVVDELLAKRPMLHVVVTGRNASPELIEIADLVSEMKVIKHPYAHGIQPQRGVEF
ncbi:MULTISPECIES: cob(I)yrinic acid a,c-diamide adenosyltransferase [Rosistilla]|uniref:corrinoid adenosyltransferase n=2 Tax=Rosistilla TaxID=2795779 RepID=A0A518IVF2_9BACT|nr:MULTISPECIES: cob(I)yrinic acid a,c-diamide adenosyltransferase [Rosistilla]QDS91112.1 Cob(I)yrinic acid a,c-diamide adenosyltransferase [Rosistilla ulvae]QDV57059.1 Cob(I)yrinic acid a,c-diamide adenosyltransferase [Rosistilla oblonga]